MSPTRHVFLTSLDEMARLCVFLVAMALVLLLLTAAIFNVALRFDHVTTSLTMYIDAVALAMLVCTGLGTLVALQSRRPGWVSSVTAVVVFGGAAVVSMIGLRPEWVSDFGTMWARALEFRDIDFAVRDIYDQRIQLVLLPAVRILGGGEWVVPFINVLCLGSALLMGSVWIRRVAGPAAALLFCLVFVSVPELLLAVGIPTHDLWGVPLIALVALAVQQSLVRGLPRNGALIWAVVGSLVMVLLQIQREIGHVAWVAALLTYAVTAAVVPKLRADEGSGPLPPESRQVAGKSLACALLMAACYPAGLAAGSGLGMFADSASYEDLVHARVGGIVPSIVRGTYGDGRSIVENFLEALPSEERGDLVQDIAASDVVLQPERRIPNALHRMKTLSYLGSQSYFYVPGLEQVRPRLAGVISSLTSWHAVGFSLLVLWSLVGMLRGGYWQPYLFPILFSAVLVAGLVLVGEVQPRYLIPLWFTGALLIASSAPRLSGVRCRSRVRPLAYLGALSLLGYLGWNVADRTYTHEEGRILEWSLDGPPAPQGAALGALMGDERINALGALGFSLQLPESPVAVQRGASTSVCTSSSGRLEFFYYMPYYHDYSVDYFDLSLFADDRRIWRVGLPSVSGIQHAVVDLPAAGCMELRFVLSTANGVPDSSWVSASRTEIYFPRVTRAD